jgi:phage N-6-adenine-methyltransferase
VRESVHFSSKSCEWETPQALFDELDREFHFDIDVCATNENAKCRAFYTKDEDGLSKEWVGTCWMNPPYGREIGKWVRKASEQVAHGAIVVCLLPARTDTKWWHEDCMNFEVRFIRGRLKFNGHKNSAPFPSAIVVMR